jgi:hypothetical protein
MLYEQTVWYRPGLTDQHVSERAARVLHRGDGARPFGLSDVAQAQSVREEVGERGGHHGQAEVVCAARHHRGKERVVDDARQTPQCRRGFSGDGREPVRSHPRHLEDFSSRVGNRKRLKRRQNSTQNARCTGGAPERPSDASSLLPSRTGGDVNCALRCLECGNWSPLASPQALRVALCSSDKSEETTIFDTSAGARGGGGSWAPSQLAGSWLLSFEQTTRA